MFNDIVVKFFHYYRMLGKDWRNLNLN